MIKLNLGSGDHPLEGFVNLDRPYWNWSWTLPFPPDSVSGVTVSHALMYCRDCHWDFVLHDIHRVLQPCGVLRITEDETEDPNSERFGGFPGALSMTSAEKLKEHLARLFPVVVVCGPEFTLFHDRSLIQQWHGAPPKVFHIEGRK